MNVSSSVRSGVAAPDSQTALQLAIVGPLPPPSGGMANQCEQLARLFRDEGVAVEVVRNNPDYRPAWIGRVPVVRAFARLLPYLLALWRSAGRADVMHVLANSGWAWHLFAAPAVWIARLRGCPVIVNYRGGHADTFFSRAPNHVFGTLKCASARVTPSTFLQHVFTRYGLDAEVVPNIVDLARFKPAPARDFGISPHLIITRNLESIYDIATALNAFADVRKVFPGARLTIAGTGPEKDRLVALAHSLGVGSAVTFSGRIANDDIPALYASADCMLNPSTVDNMPISILEALAVGVPVVSTDAGGIPDMVETGVSALLVPIGDAPAMAQACIRALSDRALGRSLREAGLSMISRYAWPHVRGQWLAIYHRLAAQRRNRSTASLREGRAR